jgi:nucleobase:cation symporter-1, NCS1 family
MAHVQNRQHPTDSPKIEIHSIDHIPESERRGKAWHQGPFWFMINATVLTILSGVYGALAGLSLTWSTLAILAGTLFGTVFAALHAVQGPRLGIPQMIQSRVQFGARGASWILAVVVFMDIGFAVFFVIMGRDALGQLTGAHPPLYAAALVAGATLVAILGYHFIHRVQRVLSILAVLVFAAITAGVVVESPFGQLFGRGGFVGTAFLLQFGISASYQLTVAPLVSSYTRYLPRKVSGRALFASVFAGSALAAVWLEFLGAAVATARPDEDLLAALSGFGRALVPGMGTALQVLTFVSMFGIVAVCLYEAVLSGLSFVDAFRPVRTSARLRVAWLVGAAVVVYALVVALPPDYLSSYNSFLMLMLYFLVPWTSINLADFYFVRRGRYAVSELLSTDGGVYGRWAVTGIVAYVAGFAVMIPFFSNPLYSGPLAGALGGSDIAIAVGIPVAALAFLLLMRRHDYTCERRVFAAEAERLLPEMQGKPDLSRSL